MTDRLLVDLCAGLGGWQAPFRDHGWDVVGLDVRPTAGADVVGDVRALPLVCDPDLVTASPPCQEFSTAWNRWTPLEDRDPDLSVYYGCRAAVHLLDPDWWVLENVGGAQRWFGPARKVCYPYFLWGHFPPFDVGDLPNKTGTDGHWTDRNVSDGPEAARIPYPLADAVRRSIKVWG